MTISASRYPSGGNPSTGTGTHLSLLRPFAVDLEPFFRWGIRKGALVTRLPQQLALYPKTYPN